MGKLNSSCIIDDDPIFVYGTKKIMKKIDFSDEVLVFNNGQEALDGLVKLAAQNKTLPSVIFLDINMPIMDGWEFLEDFVKIPNNNRENVTIYIISSSIDPMDIQKAQLYSLVNNYILKPIRITDLEKVLNDIN
ncbi:response regulator [Sediminicola sp. 1XM1-17]|uniref:response regulator n=1 Tax=Sediminicola sp. 1XM1-17 TaxID=3127702 RepID=UPI003076FA53